MKRKFLIGCVIVGSIVVIWLILGICFLPGILYRAPSLPPELKNKMVRSTSFEVVALNPVSIREMGIMVSNTEGQLEMKSTNTSTNILMDYVILGSVNITNLVLRQRLVDAVSHDVSYANHFPYACILEPRHGFRCMNGTNSILMAICYQCGDVVLKENGVETDYLIKTGAQFPASRTLFESIFHEAGVKEDSN